MKRRCCDTESKDFIIEQILSIEDFESVDERLMQEINAKDEYRRIFEEYKELSALVSEGVPNPEKDGVTLHDAVMNRIKDGDIAPRYISEGKFRFPVATVASLAVIVAAFLVIGKGGLMGGVPDADNFAPVAESKMRDVSDEEVVYIENTSFSLFGGVASNGKDDGLGIAVANEEAFALPEESEVESDGAVNGALEADREIIEGVATYSVVMDSASEEKIIFKSSGVRKAETQASPAVAEAEAAYEEIAEESVRTDIDDEVLWRMKYASDIVPRDRLITAEQIFKLGKESYIEWFDSIKDRDDFADAYSYEAFKSYCEE